MPQPRKTLTELVKEGTFRARHHHDRLLEERLPWKTLSKIQDRYRASDHELERRRIALDFERAIPQLNAKRERSRKSLPELLAGLGPAGSFERVNALFPRFFRHTNGRPFRLEGWQQDPLREFLRRDRRGRRIYNVLIFGVARGNGKTPTASGLGLEALIDDDKPHADGEEDVFQVAGSREQAGIGREFAGDWVDGGDLREFVRVKSSLHCPATGGEFRILSSDGRLAHGRKFRRGIADELWLFSTYREVQAWVALETALHKDPEADLIGITTAGYDMSSLLGQKYQAALELPDVRVSDDGCVTVARDEENGFLMWWIGAPLDADIENPKIVRACNPLSTLDPKLILKELRKPGADEHEWRRLHTNQWTKVKNAWLPTGAWRRLTASGVEAPVGAALFVAIDAAYSGDCTAVDYAWRDSDGIIHHRSRIWSTSRKYAAHVYVDGDTLINEQLVEPYIHKLARDHAIREIVFDPEYFTAEAAHLAGAGFAIAPLYPQSAEMSDAIRAAFRSVGEGKLAHDGDPVLTAHVEAAQRRKVLRGTKEFDAIEKPPGGDKIDGCTAMVMAHWRCMLGGSEEFVGGVDTYEEPEDDE